MNAVRGARKELVSETAGWKELTALLAYIQKGHLELTWDSFSLIQPFFETWGIPIEPNYLGPINSLTNNVLAHLWRTDGSQYSFIRKAGNQRLFRASKKQSNVPQI